MSSDAIEALISAQRMPIIRTVGSARSARLMFVPQRAAFFVLVTNDSTREVVTVLTEAQAIESRWWGASEAVQSARLVALRRAVTSLDGLTETLSRNKALVEFVKLSIHMQVVSDDGFHFRSASIGYLHPGDIGPGGGIRFGGQLGERVRQMVDHLLERAGARYFTQFEVRAAPGAALPWTGGVLNHPGWLNAEAASCLMRWIDHDEAVASTRLGGA